MQLTFKSVCLGITSLFIVIQNSVAQTAELSPANGTPALEGWHLKDKSTDGFEGISLQRAYQLLKGKKAESVIVAVIDSGIDTLHEDLKPVLWRNEGEIPGNQKDDDKNGYADDVHGWNFLGGKDGKNVNEDSYEAARVYHQLKEIYSDQTDTTLFSSAEKTKYAMFLRAKENLESGAMEASGNLLVLKSIYTRSKVADSLLRIVFKSSYSGNELSDFKPSNSKETEAKSVMTALYKGFDMMEAINVSLMEEFDNYYKGQERKAAAFDTPPPAYRNNVVKDDYNNIQDRSYGNTDIMAADASHGTHVSGIIGAARNNGVGMDGVAEKIKIMTLRAVPDGDEHDKDIALAIRYAADHGAKVINMSFGKSFSPQKQWVDDAVKYALTKDVLLVHAAGNDAKNTDITENYPNPVYIDTKTIAPHFITVGASGDSLTGGLIADFSNYGKQTVDVFAPGVKIYSTIPGGNTYAFQQGTSMASPVVAGIAALLRSYFPELNAIEIKKCIEGGVVKPTRKVNIPGTEEPVDMKELCRTGGVVNAYESVRIALELQKEKKKNNGAPVKKRA
ncbi:MAG: S8 family peptidase [Bacteroidetes bacterium]|nr:S8 family peptidase [Bacteroidota bacterium]